MSPHDESPRDALPDVRIASMSLIWGMLEPGQIETWLDESASLGYAGVTGFAETLEPFWDDAGPLAGELSKRRLSLAAVDSGLHSDEATYHRVFRMMRELECSLMVCIDRGLPEKEYALCARLLNRAGEIAAEYGIDVHYHNHTNAVGETLTDMERLMDLIDPEHVRVMLDVGHATKDFVELPPAERAVAFLEKYWDRINYMELKDWNETTDLNTPLGEGHADFPRIFGMIRERGYTGWLTVEQNGNDGRSLDRSPRECARVSREFIRAGLGV